MRAAPLSLRRTSAVVTSLVAGGVLVAVATGDQAAAGPPASAEFRVNTTTVDNQQFPAVAADADGDSVVVWVSTSAADVNVFAQRYDADGTPLGPETRVNTTTSNNQFEPTVAMDADGDYVVAWTSTGQDGSGLGIYFQRYAADGTPLGSETRVNTTTSNNQHEPEIGMAADGDYVVVWSSFAQDLSESGVYFQRYDAGGTPLGSETRATTTTLDDQDRPDVAMDSEGDFVLAWVSDNQGGDEGDGVYFRRFSATGSVLSLETRANSTTASDQSVPRVAMDADGDYVIAWHSTSQDGSGFGVYTQRYDIAGTALGGETRANTTTAGNQTQPSVAMDADGDYVVLWNSGLQDGSGSGVYAQRYDATGSPHGSETRVNVTTVSNQLDASAASDADGDLAVAWVGQDGSGGGIFGRRFRGPEGVDLALTQSDNADPVAVEGRVTYRLRVVNRAEPTIATGNAELDAAIGVATGVSVVSAVPDGATFHSSTGEGWACTPSAGTVRCRLGSTLLAGAVSPGLSLRYTMSDVAQPTLHHARVFGNQLDPVPTNDAEVERTNVLCSLEFTAPTYTRTEGGGPLVATVTRNGTDCGSSSVSYATTTGSATAAADYTGTAGRLTWTDAGTTRSFTVAVTDDGLDERPEHVHLQLTSPTGALLGNESLATGSILDNDAPPRINFTTTSATATEPGALLEVTARLSETSGQDVVVNLGRTGSATHLSDYFAPTRLTIPAGQRTATFGVEVVDDNLDEANETANLTLGATTTATIGTQKTWRLTITDDD